VSKVIKNQFQPLQKFKKPILQKWIRANGFLVGLVGVVVLAFFFPDPGARNGWLHAESVSDWGLAVIMLLQGLSMPLEKARQGAGNWRLRVLIQSFTFIIFPIVGLVLQLVLPIIWRTEPAAIQKGFLYLCVLPSTVSTSVVYTSVARGNTAAAVFSAAFSNLLGVFLTPALVGILMQMSGGTGSFGLPFLQIMLLTLVPFVIGMALRPLVHRLVDENKKWVNRLSNAVILFIVYSAFCGSGKSHVWEKYGLTPHNRSAGCGYIFVHGDFVASTRRFTLGWPRHS
jgi:sodium/bile acid cotransporter 7